MALVTAAAHFGLREHYAHERNRLAQKAAGARSREIAAVWKALPYTSATQVDLAAALLAKIDFASLNLTELHQLKLHSRLEEILKYLIAPSLEDYCRLKTEDLHYRFSPSRSAKMILSGTAPQTGELFLAPFPQERSHPVGKPLSPYLSSVTGGGVHSTELQDESSGLVVTREVWEKLCGPGGRAAVSAFTGICLEHVSVAVTSTNSPTALLQGSVGKGWTTATEAVNPGFEYPALIDRPTISGEKSLFFQLSFFAQSQGGEKAGPVYVCLGWVPEDQEWALCRMMWDSMLGIHILF